MRGDRLPRALVAELPICFTRGAARPSKRPAYESLPASCRRRARPYVIEVIQPFITSLIVPPATASSSASSRPRSSFCSIMMSMSVARFEVPCDDRPYHWWFAASSPIASNSSVTQITRLRLLNKIGAAAVADQAPHRGRDQEAVGMSAHEADLRRRLASGEDVEVTAEWFIGRMAKDARAADDLSSFELAFWRRITRAFLRWRRRRSLN